jgi:hypothetical protein
MLNHYQRVLTIDGEHINLVAAEGKNFFDIGKSTNSFHAGSVSSCKQIGTTATFRLIVSGKQFDLEASSAQEAGIMSFNVRGYMYFDFTY